MSRKLTNAFNPSDDSERPGAARLAALFCEKASAPVLTIAPAVPVAAYDHNGPA